MFVLLQAESTKVAFQGPSQVDSHMSDAGESSSWRHQFGSFCSLFRLTEEEFNISETLPHMTALAEIEQSVQGTWGERWGTKLFISFLGHEAGK